MADPRPAPVSTFPWLTIAFLGVAALLAALPAGWLEYDRSRVAAGEVWRLATGQLVHWTPRMALFDLGTIACLGGLLEISRERPRLALAGALGWLASAGAIQLAPPHLERYRGSSGLAMALLAAAVVAALLSKSGLSRVTGRILGLGLLALALAKVLTEARLGQPFFAGDLPAGIVVAPAVHGAGLIAGLTAGIALRLAPAFRRHP